MMTTLLLTIAVSPIAGQMPVTYDHVLVAEKVAEIGLTPEQARRLLPVAEGLHSASERFEREMRELDVQEDFTDIASALLSGRELTNEERRYWDSAKAARAQAESRFRLTRVNLYARALQEFSGRQLFALVGREKRYEQILAVVDKIRTASDEEWPRIREIVSTMLSDPPYLALYGTAIADWERRTGRRSDIGDERVTIEDLGIGRELERIRDAARSEVERLRGRNMSDRDVIALTDRLLAQALNDLRTWPSNGYTYLGPRDGHLPVFEHREAAASHPNFPGNMIARYLFGLMQSESSLTVLGQMANRSAN